MNNVILVGNLVKKAESRISNNEEGTIVTKFNIGVRGYRKEKVDFFYCTVFGKQGEVIEKYFNKGDQIIINGRIENSSYEKDGEIRYSTNIIVNNFSFGAKKKDIIEGKRKEEEGKDKR